MILVNRAYSKIYYVLLALSLLGCIYFLFFEGVGDALIYVCMAIYFNALGYFVFLKINSIFIKFKFLFFYIGYLISMPIVFINKEQFTRNGWSGIGDYNFELTKTFEALLLVSLYIFIFVLVSFIVDRVLIKKYKIQEAQLSFNPLKALRKYRYIFVVLLIFQLYLSYFMMQYKIGIVGLIPEELPFRLVGALYYYRYIVIPIIAGLLLFSNFGRKNNFFIFIIILEATLSGVFSASKSVAIFHMIPVIAYLLTVNRNKLSIAMLFLTFAITSIASLVRNLLFYLDDLHSVTFTTLIDYFVSYEGFNFEYIFKMISVIITRIGGYQEFFATYFNDLKHVDINLFFEGVLGFNFFSNHNFNIMRDIYGFEAPEGYSFGIAIDPISYLYLSSSNILVVILLITIWVVLLIGTEKILNIIFIKYIKNSLYIIILNIYILLAMVNPNIKVIFFNIPIYLFLLFLMIKCLPPYKRNNCFFPCNPPKN